MSDTVTTVTGSFIAIFLALGIAMVKVHTQLDLFSMFQAVLEFLAPPLSTVFLIEVLWKRAAAMAANLVLTVATAVSFGVGICFFIKWPTADFWPHFMLLSFYLFVALSTFMIVVSLLTTPDARKANSLPTQTEAYSQTGRIDRKSWICWFSLAVVMVALYCFFK